MEGEREADGRYAGDRPRSIGGEEREEEREEKGKRRGREEYSASKKEIVLTDNLFFDVAERTRFELVKPFGGLHAFQACLLNHSSISPWWFAGAKL